MTHAEFALAVRKDVLTMLHTSLESHIGSCYSAIDILTVLYNSILRYDSANPQWEERDKFLLSKGHGVAALYAVLARVGYFPMSKLALFCQNGTDYQGHSRRDFIPGIEISAGSLGHGLNIATGMAYANRLKENSGHIYVLLGDGECNEGSVWEAVMFAKKHRLNNLTAVIDRNMLQAYGSDKQILDMGDLGQRFHVFGWQVLDINGHDYNQIDNALRFRTDDAPVVVIAHTVKGKGISFMENKHEWHFFSPDKEHFKEGMEELNNA